jgi:hypothetical protein
VRQNDSVLTHRFFSGHRKELVSQSNAIIIYTEERFSAGSPVPLVAAEDPPAVIAAEREDLPAADGLSIHIVPDTFPAFLSASFPTTITLLAQKRTRYAFPSLSRRLKNTARFLAP